MLKISYSKGAQAAPGAPRGLQGPQGPKGRPLGVVRMTLEGTSLRSELTKEFALVLLASSLWRNDELIWECFFALFFRLRTFFFQFDAGSFRRNFFSQKTLVFSFHFFFQSHSLKFFQILTNLHFCHTFGLFSTFVIFSHIYTFWLHMHLLAKTTFSRCQTGIFFYRMFFVLNSYSNPAYLHFFFYQTCKLPLRAFEPQMSPPYDSALIQMLSLIF